jgi:hypothetical protein
MAYTRRDIRGGAVQTTLTGSITNADASCVLASSSGWPDGSTGGFFVVIDPATASEEKILCSTRSGTTVNFTTRGADGTSAAAHTSGAVIYPCITKTDLDEANYAVSQTIGLVTTQGDILVGSSANTLTRVAKGTSGLPLVAGASTLSYTALSSTGLATDSVTATQIAAGAVGSSELAANAVTAAAIANATITDVQVAAANKDGAAGIASLRTIGTGGAQACAGNDARLSDARTPLGNSITTSDQFVTGLGPVYYGTDANLPGVFSGPAGSVYYATDTFLYYARVGSAWVCTTPRSATVATSEGTTGTSFGNLTTTGPAITTLTGTKALVRLNGFLQSNTAADGAAIGFAISGATTVAASDANSLAKIFSNTANTYTRQGIEIYVTGLTAGSNVFTMKYKALVGGTATFSDRTITVTGIPS